VKIGLVDTEIALLIFKKK